MPIGLYRVEGGWAGQDDSVRIRDEGGIEMAIERSRYEERGYEPPYEALPTKSEYDAGNT